MIISAVWSNTEIEIVTLTLLRSFQMPQNEHIELHRKRHGRRLDHEERQRKKEAREPRRRAKKAKKLRGLKAKMYNKERFNEKVQLKKKIKAFEEKQTDVSVERPDEGALPAYLLDRKEKQSGKAISQQVSRRSSLSISAIEMSLRSTNTHWTVKSRFNEWPLSAHFHSLNRDFLMRYPILVTRFRSLNRDFTVFRTQSSVF